jgi:phosphatidylglycerol lysyltransferase
MAGFRRSTGAPASLQRTTGKQRPRPARSADRLIRLGVWLLALAAICGAAAMAASHLAGTLNYHDLVHAMRRTPWHAVGAACAMTLLSYVTLIASDVCAARYAQVRPPAGVLLLASFCGYALGNAAGFGSISGGAVRYRIYSVAQLHPGQIARIVGYLAVAFTLGAPLVAIFATLLTAVQVAQLFGWSASLLRWGAIAGLALLGMLLYAGNRGTFDIRRIRVRLPTPGLMLAQLALTALDIAAAGATLWFVLPDGRPEFMPFIAVYAAALVLGAASHVPAGVGVFEVAILTAFGNTMPASSVAGALLVYRAIYFLAPLCAAAALLAAHEVRRASAAIGGLAVSPVVKATARLTPTVLAFLVFFAGAVLIISGATPAFRSRLALLQATVPLWVVEGANFLSSVAGVILLFVARGLLHRLDGAWWMTLFAASAGLFFVLASGVAVGEATLIGFIVALLVVSRHQFQRHASLLNEPLTARWLAAVALVIALAAGLLVFAHEDVQFTRDLWWQLAFDAQAPRGLRAVVGAAVIAMALAVWQLLRPPSGRPTPVTAAEIENAARIVRGQERANANLALLGDKHFLFSHSGQCFMMYAKRGRTWVALFDPVGPQSEWRALIGRFVDMVHAHGGRAAFYQITPESLPIYLDAGLSVLKLGEEARVDLETFDLRGSARADLRYALSRGQREGLRLELIPPPEVERVLPALERISDAWLAERNIREKGFSVARFEPQFVRSQRIALLWHGEEPVAFASIMTTPLGKEAALGLMRHLPQAPRYAMENLFVQLILALKEQGYRTLDLGMSPLTGLHVHPLASRWNRLAAWLERHGRPLYNFSGLRTFKSKFDPRWEPRYLAASGLVGPYLALADTAIITGRGLKGIFTR